MAAAHGKALVGDLLRTMRQHRRFAAEQMRRAGDVQQQAVRRIQRHQRREAVAPVGDVFQQRGIGFFIGRHDCRAAAPSPGHWPRAGLYKGPAVRPVPPAHGHKRVAGSSADDQRRLKRRAAACAVSRSVGRRGSHSARIRRFETFHLRNSIASGNVPARPPVADQLRVEDRIAPIIVIGARRCARHLPAGQRRAGFGLRAFAQQNGDAAFTGRESQPAAGHQIQAFGLASISSSSAPTCGQARMSLAAARASAALGVRTRISCARIAAQLQQPVGEARHIPGPHNRAAPRTAVSSRRQHRQQRQNRRRSSRRRRLRATRRAATRRPAPHPPVHHPGPRRPVRRQAVTRQGMAQFRQFCNFVHDMFYNAPGRGVKRNPIVENRLDRRALINCAHLSCCAATGGVFT